MRDANAIWRSRTDDKVIEAARALEDYTEEGEQLIRSELRRRGLPEPEAAIGHCERCGRSVHRTNKHRICPHCDEPYPVALLSIEGMTAQPETTDPQLVGIATDESVEKVKDRHREAESRRNMLLGALWCLGGLAVTLITYEAAGEGQRFVVAYGAMAFGALQFLRGLSHFTG